MDKPFRPESAMTLAELLIASALVGIVTLGLIASEHAIRTSRVSSARDTVLTAQLQAAMIRLSRDVSLTVGDASDEGIKEFSTSGTTCCFRMAAGDPNTYSGDPWNCWWADSGTKELKRCGNLLEANAIAACAGAGIGDIEVVTRLSDINFCEIIRDGSNRIENILITLKSRPDVNSASNHISNPEYTLTTQINPPGLSR